MSNKEKKNEIKAQIEIISPTRLTIKVFQQNKKIRK